MAKNECFSKNSIINQGSLMNTDKNREKSDNHGMTSPGRHYVSMGVAPWLIYNNTRYH
jgi:hypothetical protein